MLLALGGGSPGCAGGSGALTRARASADAAEARVSGPDAIVGRGEGSTRDAAVAAARANGLASVKSVITSRSRSLIEELSHAGRVTVDRRFVNDVEIRVDSEYGPFFAVVEASGRDQWVAVVAARRAELDRVLAAEAERTVAPLESAWNRIEAAGSWVEAAPVWCGARSLEHRLDGLDLQRLAVAGRRAWTPELLARRRALHEHVQMAKSATRILVGRPASPLHPDGTPVVASMPDATTDVVAALRDAGWLAEVGDARCADGDALLVQARLDSQCQRNALGVEQCSAWMAWEGRRCGIERALFSVSTEKAVGWNSTDRAAALRKAVGALALAHASRDVRGRLLELLGEECSGQAGGGRRGSQGPRVTGVTEVRATVK